MIDDISSLKQAMAQMDAEDPVVSQAAKERAAQILNRARLSFAKVAELIEQRRLLLRPKILANLKRMDEPVLGEAAFRDAGSALRHEGQSFRQIAEAIELSGNAAPRYDNSVRKSESKSEPRNEPWRDMVGEPGALTWARAANVVLRFVFFPLRHPIQFLTIALLATVLFNVLRGVTVGRQISGFVDGVAGVRKRTDAAINSASSLLDKKASPQTGEAASPPAPSAPAPSPPSASPSPSTDSAPPANEAAPAPAPPAPSQASTARPDARGAASRLATSDRPQTARPRAFGDLMPAELRRNSRGAGPCIGGTGGCYWGGRQY